MSADDDVTAFLADVRMQAEDHRLVPAHMVFPLLAVAGKVLGAHRNAGGPCVARLERRRQVSRTALVAGDRREPGRRPPPWTAPDFPAQTGASVKPLTCT